MRSCMRLQGLKRTELRDELYMQLVKQSRGNGSPSAVRAWELLALNASTMPPSKEYVGLVSEYVHGIAHFDGELPEGVRELALRTWHALKRSAKAGARVTVGAIFCIHHAFVCALSLNRSEAACGCTGTSA